ncbi:[Fe-Fe] hydrogenase large subunit C-terminal domain-containing protein [Beduinella massiliensis]|uniref:[Fe-Fe] hydrogenase large subunit C-terminal domain-containing protein n=1 Tax=Beduinella massiliensis TaxID=1852363 RepID=UPI000C858CC1
MSIISLKKANCKHCYKCVKNCPVKSIQVVGGQAKIIEKTCVLCGTCLLVCPQHAKTLESDLSLVQQWVREGRQVVASLAPAFTGSFEGTGKQMVSALLALGFDRVSETALGAAYVTTEFVRLVREEKMEHIITSCCPVVNDFIEKHHPDMLPYLAPVVSPMVAHGTLLHSQLGEDVKVVFIGPCIAKKQEARDIRHDSAIDAVLTFDDLAAWLSQAGVRPQDMEETPFFNANPSIARMYPVPGGVNETVRRLMGEEGTSYYNFLDVTGLTNCGELFEAIRHGDMQHCFMELNACVGGCTGGPARSEHAHSRFESRLRVSDRTKRSSREYPPTPESLRMRKVFTDRSEKEDVPGEEVIRAILRQTGKETPEQELNCGMCGYNSCREKAIAVYQGKAELNMCIPYMRERAESLSEVVLTATPNVTIIVDRDLNICEFNRAAEQKFGIPRAEALKKCLFELMDASDFQFVLETRESIEDKRVTLQEQGLAALETVVYIPEGDMAMGILRDISAEVAREESQYKLRVETIEQTQKVIDKQMVVAQQIASLLGETTAETKVTLTKLKNMIVYDGEKP